MDAKQIATLGRQLNRFLAEFSDCFGRSEPRQHLRTYVRGQLSDLPRKSAEPIALAAGTPPRTLQRFLEAVQWDQHRLRDRLQWIVARDHAHPQALGVIDEQGDPKKGGKTAAVQRQWCGHSGKLDNCVVAVHSSYVAGDFHCLIDSDLFLPQDWAQDPQRRQEAHIPDEVGYRKKTRIALDQVQRALGNGIRVAAWTFDELYGRDREFLDGLESLGQNYVGEIPCDFSGWLREPTLLLRPTPQQMRKQGRKRPFPRLAAQTPPACEVRNLVQYSPRFRKQSWQRFHIKDGEKGPQVWEVKAARFYRKHDQGLPGKPHILIVARNVLDPDEIKYFLSNLPPGTLLEWMLWVAFSRWPIERCFQQAKDELGLDHFEVRSWGAIHRHLYITQLSHLFCARVHQQLREKKHSNAVPDRRAGASGRFGVAEGPRAVAFGPLAALSEDRGANRLLPASQPASATFPRQDDPPPFTEAGHPGRPVEIVCAG